MTRNCLALLGLLAFVRPTYADVSVRVLPTQVADSETCGLTWTGRCEQGVWCDSDYIPVAVPYGDAVATHNCGGHFGQVFSWGASGYGTAESFQPIGAGGPIKVASWIQWGERGPDAIEFRVHNVGLYEYIGDFLNGDADFNSDGATTLDDLFAYLAVLLG